MTNYEYLRQMPIEEFADWLDSTTNEYREDWYPLGCYSCAFMGTHHEEEYCPNCDWKGGILGWLKKEVSE